MLWLVYSSAVILFSISFFLLRIIKTSGDIISAALFSVELLTNHLLSDEQKQKKIQHLALKMAQQFFLLMLKIIVLAISVLVPFYGADSLGFVDFSESTAFAMRIDIIVVTTIIALMVYFFWQKIYPKKETLNESSSTETAYSNLERVIHNIAFGSANLQRTLNDIEVKYFSRKWIEARASKPVFITSLPRAGTTILLEAMSRLPNMASHTYRDMPFIFSPVLWAKISSTFQNKSDMKERAHGDGLLVNEDSPEAFEEVLWHKFFPQKYQQNRIQLWQKADDGFLKFFHEYTKRIIYLRLPDALQKGRYLSKNNANIARIPVLKEMFPDCAIVVPVRDPFEHAISLHRQHLNFQKKHNGESFTKKYMADIGHFEFGELHRPINFRELDTLIADLKPESCDYWLAYWIAAFTHLQTVDSVIFVSYEALCVDGENTLVNLCKQLAIDASPQQIKTAAQLLKGAPTRKQDYVFSETLSQRARHLYQQLLVQ